MGRLGQSEKFEGRSWICLICGYECVWGNDTGCIDSIAAKVWASPVQSQRKSLRKMQSLPLARAQFESCA